MPLIVVRADGLGDARQQAEAGAELGGRKGKGSSGRAGRGREGGEQRGRNISHDFFCEEIGTWGNKTIFVLLMNVSASMILQTGI